MQLRQRDLARTLTSLSNKLRGYKDSSLRPFGSQSVERFSETPCVSWWRDASNQIKLDFHFIAEENSN